MEFTEVLRAGSSMGGEGEGVGMRISKLWKIRGEEVVGLLCSFGCFFCMFACVLRGPAIT